MTEITDILRTLLNDTDALRAKVAVTFDNANDGMMAYTRNLETAAGEHMAAIDALSTLEQALEDAGTAFAMAVKDMEDDTAGEQEYEAEKRIQRGAVL